MFKSIKNLVSEVTNQEDLFMPTECVVCCSSQPVLSCDKIYTVQDVSAHFLCLLFSSGLEQKGDDSDGIEGFLIGDIMKEVRRGSRLRCSFCRKKGATVGCAEKKCKKKYHPICGQEQGCLFQYFDEFKSFCKDHRRIEDLNLCKIDVGNASCSICQEEIEFKDPFKILWVPCCHSYFHKNCIQCQAISAGDEHLRCANCNNGPEFMEKLKVSGIYIPEQDASWEQEGRFEDVDKEIILVCSARSCSCPNEDGRSFHDGGGGPWEIVICESCGSEAIHKKCASLNKTLAKSWNCGTCRKGLQSWNAISKKSLGRPHKMSKEKKNRHSLPAHTFSTKNLRIDIPIKQLLPLKISGIEEVDSIKDIEITRVRTIPSSISEDDTDSLTSKDLLTSPVCKTNSKRSFTDLFDSTMDPVEISFKNLENELNQDDVVRRKSFNGRSQTFVSERKRKRIEYF